MTTPLPAGDPGYESVRVMRLEPGDVIVFRYDGEITMAEVGRIQARIERTFPGHKAVVLERGMEISVARSGEVT